MKRTTPLGEIRRALSILEETWFEMRSSSDVLFQGLHHGLLVLLFGGLHDHLFEPVLA